jgi:DNA-directed RNA polymerase subunit alpha
VCDKETQTDSYGRFTVEPFERGFGTTIGNSLRRILLSSLEGTAPVSLRIKGVSHEFESPKGILEDVPHIVLAVKKLQVALNTDAPKVLTLKVSKKGDALAISRRNATATPPSTGSDPHSADGQATRNSRPRLWHVAIPAMP